MNVAAVSQEALLIAPAKTPDGSITGTIRAVRFYNPRTGWAVLSICVDNEFLTAVGSVINPREGDEYRFTGSFVTDPKYGRQFRIDSADVLLPSSRKGMIRYLSSIAAGVGEVRAARIVGAIGDDALSRLHADPSLLDGMDFLSGPQREEIKAHLREHAAVAEVSGLICKEGVTPGLAARIVVAFGEDAVRVCKEDPYRLTEVEGIGFLTADRVAMTTGIPPNAPARLRAAILHVLAEARDAEGHCFARPSDLMRYLSALLGADVGVPLVADAVAMLIHAELLVREGDSIYLPSLYADEEVAAAMVGTLAGAAAPAITTLDLDKRISAAEASTGVSYHPRQREAVRMALSSGFSIITGGPGTGKSLLTRTIVDIWRAERPSRPVYLCSPTGRAAKRLSEVTGYDAKTIHRLLGYVPEIGFTVTESTPLAPGLLVADEASMLDISLARALLSACAGGMQVVLVGDVDQLPSVGPGSVLRDIIDSGTVPVTRLEYVYRQEAGSGIAALAHAVNTGNLADLATLPDVRGYEVQNPDEAMPLAVAEARAAYRETGLLGFTVLAPGHRGSAGVKALNAAIRAALNPGARGDFSQGDRVMVIKNNYDHDIFNGDLGVVREFDDKSGSLDVDFGNRRVRFGGGSNDEEPSAPLDILRLAYASTVHKSQGGEYPVVIAILTRQHWIMLARNLFYTAVTRAKHRLVIIHQSGCVSQAVRNNRIANRRSNLTARLLAMATTTPSDGGLPSE